MVSKEIRNTKKAEMEEKCRNVPIANVLIWIEMVRDYPRLRDVSGTVEIIKIWMEVHPGVLDEMITAKELEDCQQKGYVVAAKHNWEQAFLGQYKYRVVYWIDEMKKYTNLADISIKEVIKDENEDKVNVVLWNGYKAEANKSWRCASKVTDVRGDGNLHDWRVFFVGEMRRAIDSANKIFPDRLSLSDINTSEEKITELLAR